MLDVVFTMCTKVLSRTVPEQNITTDPHAAMTATNTFRLLYRYVEITSDRVNHSVAEIICLYSRQTGVNLYVDG